MQFPKLYVCVSQEKPILDDHQCDSAVEVYEVTFYLILGNAGHFCDVPDAYRGCSPMISLKISYILMEMTPGYTKDLPFSLLPFSFFLFPSFFLVIWSMIRRLQVRLV